MNDSPPRTVLHTNRVRRLRIPRHSIRRLIHTLDARAREWTAPPGELSIAFLGPRAIAEVHAAFLGDHSATDVITFPGSARAEFGGEICVCPHLAQQAAATANHSFAEELTLYVVHGWLHLAGLDDRAARDRRRMRAAESHCLRLLCRCDAIPRFGWAAN